MCCNNNIRVCCNPFNKAKHNRTIDVLPVTQYEREQYSGYLEDATRICSLCRLQLMQPMPEDQLDDFFLLVDVLNQMTENVEDQRPVDDEHSDAIRELQQQLRAIADERTANDDSLSEKSSLSGIDMLLAAAEFVEENDTNFGTINR